MQIRRDGVYIVFIFVEILVFEQDILMNVYDQFDNDI